MRIQKHQHPPKICTLTSVNDKLFFDILTNISFEMYMFPVVQFNRAVI